MDVQEFQEIRALFDRAERESDPHRKLAKLEEALDLLDALSEDEDLPPSKQSLMQNMRRSNARRLLAQLVGLRNVQFDVWFSYLSVLLFRFGREVDAILKEDDDLREGYRAFVGLWGPKAEEALQSVLAKSKNGL